MKQKKYFPFWISIGCLVLAACTNTKNTSETLNTENNIYMTDSVKLASLTQVKITTNVGNLVIVLYNETPKHRDNFIKLATDGFYNNTLFHRVIKEFMVQGGDPTSIGAPANKSLGEGGPDYTIPAEFNPNLFHIKGAIAAARESDVNNPTKASSGSQFYIVKGRPFPDSIFTQLAENKAMMLFLTNPANKEYGMRFEAYEKQQNALGIQSLNEEVSKKVKPLMDSLFKAVPQNVKALYSSRGGYPSLDQQYTVFGFLVSGYETLEKIQSSPTNTTDRPLEDIKIISMQIIKPK